MFGGPYDEGGGTGPSGRQPHGRQQQHRPPTSPSVDPAAGAPHAYYGQAQGYQQQWLPAQFAGFSLGGYGGGAQPYYAAAPGMPASPVPAGPGPGADAYMAMQPPQFPLGLPPDGMAPRGWGGMQLHDQQHDPGYGGRCARGLPAATAGRLKRAVLACAPGCRRHAPSSLHVLAHSLTPRCQHL